MVRNPSKFEVVVSNDETNELDEAKLNNAFVYAIRCIYNEPVFETIISDKVSLDYIIGEFTRYKNYLVKERIDVSRAAPSVEMRSRRVIAILKRFANGRHIFLIQQAKYQGVFYGKPIEKLVPHEATRALHPDSTMVRMSVMVEVIIALLGSESTSLSLAQSIEVIAWTSIISKTQNLDFSEELRTELSDLIWSVGRGAAILARLNNADSSKLHNIQSKFAQPFKRLKTQGHEVAKVFDAEELSYLLGNSLESHTITLDDGEVFQSRDLVSIMIEQFSRINYNIFVNSKRIISSFLIEHFAISVDDATRVAPQIQELIDNLLPPPVPTDGSNLPDDLYKLTVNLRPYEANKAFREWIRVNNNIPMYVDALSKDKTLNPSVYYNAHWKPYADAKLLYRDDLKAIDGFLEKKLAQYKYNHGKEREISMPPDASIRDERILKTAEFTSAEYSLALSRINARHSASRKYETLRFQKDQ